MITMHGYPPTVPLGDALPVDFRQEILDRLDALKKSKYWLVQQVHGRMGSNTVYDFLKEESPTEIGSKKLELLLNVLEKAEQEMKKEGKAPPL